MLCPLGPVMEGAALNVTVISYLDNLDVGLIACREVVPDLWDLAHAFEFALDELRSAAEARTGDAFDAIQTPREPATPA